MRKGLYSVIYMFIITICFTSVVSSVSFLSKEKIRINMEARLQSVVLDVLKIHVAAGAGPEEFVNVFKERVKTIRLKDNDIYIGYDETGLSVTGYAFSITGPGFWGPVSCMIGIDKDYSRILRVNFYKNTETPGLGARITETWFKSQFNGLLLSSRDDEGRIIALTRTSAGQGINEFDGITGATETSRAVEKLLNKELDRFVKEMVPLIREEI